MAGMAYPRRHIVKSHAAAAVGTVSSLAVAKNVSRQSLTIQNPTGGQMVWLKLQVGNAASQLVDPIATANSGSLELPPGTTFSTTDYTGPVAMITLTAPTSVNVVDL